jgi:hypothetical protein
LKHDVMPQSRLIRSLFARMCLVVPMLSQYLDSPTSESLFQLCHSWRASHPSASVLALVCEPQAEMIKPLQEAARSAELGLHGAVVPGVIVDGEFHRTGLLLLALDGEPPTIMVPIPTGGPGATDGPIAVLADFVHQHASATAGQDTLLIFVDAMVPKVASLLDRLYYECGDQVHYAGTSIGSERFVAMPCLFDTTEVVQHALLAILLRDNSGPTMAHGYQGDVTLRVATEIEGNRIRRINGRVAFEVYQELMAEEYGIALDRENFYEYGVHFPFAFNRVSGESLVRIPVSVEEDGSILCIGEVPENALLGVVRAVDAGDTRAASSVGNAEPLRGAAGAFVIYCAGRYLHLGGEAAAAELEVLRQRLPSAAIPGVLSLGEIGTPATEGYPQFCNATLLAIPWC